MLRTRKTKEVIVSAGRGARRRDAPLGRHGEEAGGVVRLVLDVAGEDGQPVDLARELGGERREAAVAGAGDDLGRSGGVGPDPPLDAVRGEEVAALAEQDGVAHRGPDVGGSCPEGRAG
jgi:hypothetical protein